jgi:peptidoglycan/LPS O-acetylase OafA/YrhL
MAGGTAEKQLLAASDGSAKVNITGSTDGMGQLTGVLDEAPVATPLDQRRFYQPELDGLRFYAFLGVFVCHTLPPAETFYSGLHLPMPGLWAATVRSGGAGVDLFFALSAFLITSLVLKEREGTGVISLRLFYIRRILRIWPLYFLVVALGILFAHTMNHPIPWYYQQSLSLYYVLGYLLFISNWVYAVYGAAQSVCAPLWTVSIEEQFYLIWPALMKILKRRGMTVAASVTFALAAASQAGVVLFGASPGYVVFGSASRCESLAVGVLLALCSHRLPRPTQRIRLFLFVFGLGGWIVSSWWFLDQPGPASMRVVLGRLIVSLASGAMLYGCLHSRSRIVTGHWVVRLGKVSYGLYMLHFTGLLVVATLIHPVGRPELLLTKVLGFAVTVFLAFASYRWVESPFLRLKDRFATVLSRPV